MYQYSQRDPRWKNTPLGFGEKETIGNFGCLLTASAMVLSNYGIIINPLELNNRLKENGGFDGALMYFSIIRILFGTRSYLTSPQMAFPNVTDYINQLLANNVLPIVEVDSSTRSGFQNHWVTIYKRDGDKHFISDPWTEKPEEETVTLESRYGFAGKTSGIINNIFVIEPLAVKPEPPKQPEGDKMVVVTDGLRLRTGPSTSAQELTRLPYGTELTPWGNPVPDGGIVWQPVLLFVAEKNGDAVYLKKK